MVSKNEIMPPTVIRIISFLKKNLAQPVSIRSISKSIAISYNSCHKMVRRLEKEGIIDIKSQSGVSYCRLSSSVRSALLLSYVCGLQACSFLSTKSIIKRIVEEFNRKFPTEIESFIIFGSYALGKEKKNSDVDLFSISIHKKELETFGRFLGMKYGVEIQIIVATPVDFKEMLITEGITVGKEVVEKGIIFYGGERFWTIVLSVLSPRKEFRI